MLIIYSIFLIFHLNFPFTAPPPSLSHSLHSFLFFIHFSFVVAHYLPSSFFLVNLSFVVAHYLYLTPSFSYISLLCNDLSDDLYLQFSLIHSYKCPFSATLSYEYVHSLLWMRDTNLISLPFVPLSHIYYIPCLFLHIFSLILILYPPLFIFLITQYFNFQVIRLLLDILLQFNPISLEQLFLCTF